MILWASTTGLPKWKHPEKENNLAKWYNGIAHITWLHGFLWCAFGTYDSENISIRRVDYLFENLKESTDSQRDLIEIMKAFRSFGILSISHAKNSSIFVIDKNLFTRAVWIIKKLFQNLFHHLDYIFKTMQCKPGVIIFSCIVLFFFNYYFEQQSESQ